MTKTISDKGRKKAISMATKRPYEQTISYLYPGFAKAAGRCVDIEEINPKKLSPNSPLQVEWQCNCGNKSIFKVIDVVKKRNSTLCYDCKLKHNKSKSMEKGLPEAKRLNTLLPLISKQFVRFIEYPSLTVKSVSVNSVENIEWKCSCGNLFILKPANKHMRDLSAQDILLCSECIYKERKTNNFGRANVSGATFLKDAAPEIYDKLVSLSDPKDTLALNKIGPKSRKKGIWLCDCGIQFSRQISTVYNSNKVVCNVCSRKGESLFELEIKELLQSSLNLNIELQHSKSNLPKVDLFIPKHDIAIQLDPYYFHKEREHRDFAINEKHKRVYQKVIRVREEPLKQFDNSISISVDVKIIEEWLDKTLEALDLPYKKLNKADFDLALEKANAIWNQSNNFLKNNLTQSEYFPYFTKNITHPGRRPNFTPLHSGDKCLFTCKNNHEWITTLNALHRRGRITGCPKCKKGIL